MSQLVNYSIIEAGLRALADKAHESAVAQAEGKPIPCGLSEGDMELVALLTAMMNDTQANKGWCAHEMGKSISSFEKYVHDGKIPVESFGRRRGSFGHWGYCVTNPICINGMDRNLQAYISHMCYGNSRIESYDTEEVYSVSIFDKPVYKISLLIKDSRKVICLYFIESAYMNVNLFPDGFSDYTIYEKAGNR